jgi:hypothetical protein
MDNQQPIYALSIVLSADINPANAMLATFFTMTKR